MSDVLGKTLGGVRKSKLRVDALQQAYQSASSCYNNRRNKNTRQQHEDESKFKRLMGFFFGEEAGPPNNTEPNAKDDNIINLLRLEPPKAQFVKESQSQHCNRIIQEIFGQEENEKVPYDEMQVDSSNPDKIMNDFLRSSLQPIKAKNNVPVSVSQEACSLKSIQPNLNIDSKTHSLQLKPTKVKFIKEDENQHSGHVIQQVFTQTEKQNKGPLLYSTHKTKINMQVDSTNSDKIFNDFFTSTLEPITVNKEVPSYFSEEAWPSNNSKPNINDDNKTSLLKSKLPNAKNIENPKNQICNRIIDQVFGAEDNDIEKYKNSLKTEMQNDKIMNNLYKSTSRHSKRNNAYVFENSNTTSKYSVKDNIASNQHGMKTDVLNLPKHKKRKDDKEMKEKIILRIKNIKAEDNLKNYINIKEVPTTEQHIEEFNTVPKINSSPFNVGLSSGSKPRGRCKKYKKIYTDVFKSPRYRSPSKKLDRSVVRCHRSRNRDVDRKRPYRRYSPPIFPLLDKNYKTDDIVEQRLSVLNNSKKVIDWNNVLETQMSVDQKEKCSNPETIMKCLLNSSRGSSTVKTSLFALQCFSNDKGGSDKIDNAYHKIDDIVQTKELLRIKNDKTQENIKNESTGIMAVPTATELKSSLKSPERSPSALIFPHMAFSNAEMVRKCKYEKLPILHEDVLTSLMTHYSEALENSRKKQQSQAKPTPNLPFLHKTARKNEIFDKSTKICTCEEEPLENITLLEDEKPKIRPHENVSEVQEKLILQLQSGTTQEKFQNETMSIEEVPTAEQHIEEFNTVPDIKQISRKSLSELKGRNLRYARSLDVLASNRFKSLTNKLNENAMKYDKNRQRDIENYITLSKNVENETNDQPVKNDVNICKCAESSFTEQEINPDSQKNPKKDCLRAEIMKKFKIEKLPVSHDDILSAYTKQYSEMLEKKYRKEQPQFNADSHLPMGKNLRENTIAQKNYSECMNKRERFENINVLESEMPKSPTNSIQKSVEEIQKELISRLQAINAENLKNDTVRINEFPSAKQLEVFNAVPKIDKSSVYVDPRSDFTTQGDGNVKYEESTINIESSAQNVDQCKHTIQSQIIRNEMKAQPEEKDLNNPKSSLTGPELNPCTYLFQFNFKDFSSAAMVQKEKLENFPMPHKDVTATIVPIPDVTKMNFEEQHSHIKCTPPTFPLLHETSRKNDIPVIKDDSKKHFVQIESSKTKITNECQNDRCDILIHQIFGEEESENRSIDYNTFKAEKPVIVQAVSSKSTKAKDNVPVLDSSLTTLQCPSNDKEIRGKTGKLSTTTVALTSPKNKSLKSEDKANLNALRNALDRYKSRKRSLEQLFRTRIRSGQPLKVNFKSSTTIKPTIKSEIKEQTVKVNLKKSPEDVKSPLRKEATAQPLKVNFKSPTNIKSSLRSETSVQTVNTSELIKETKPEQDKLKPTDLVKSSFVNEMQVNAVKEEFKNHDCVQYSFPTSKSKLHQPVAEQSQTSDIIETLTRPELHPCAIIFNFSQMDLSIEEMLKSVSYEKLPVVHEDAATLSKTQPNKVVEDFEKEQTYLYHTPVFPLLREVFKNNEIVEKTLTESSLSNIKTCNIVKETKKPDLDDDK